MLDTKPLAGSFSQAAPPPKIVFIVGRNASGHYMLRDSIANLANFGIACDIYLTDALPTPALKAKLEVPEVQNLRFFETLMIDHGYPVLEHYMIPVQEGELISNQMYTPRQLANHYTARGTAVRLQNMLDINADAFVQTIINDEQIVLMYNIRGMQKYQNPLIAAIEEKKYRGNNGRIVNCHPADVFAYPGTNTAFWNRMNGSIENVVTLHVIDEDWDTGPFLDRTTAPLKSGKTLMQDMLAMRQAAAGMITNDATMFLNGSPRVPTPQGQISTPKRDTNYSHATHEEWLEGYRRGIRVADPESFLDALVTDYTGPRNVKASKDLKHSLAKALKNWQEYYVDLYRSTYDAIPPEYGDSPKQYIISVPPAPSKGLVNGTSPTRTTTNTITPQTATTSGGSGAIGKASIVPTWATDGFHANDSDPDDLFGMSTPSLHLP